MKLHQQTKSVFGGTDVWKTSEWALALLSLITGCFAISIVPFIRRDFGERYLGWLNLFFGYTVVANFTFLGSLITMTTGRGGGQLMFFFWVAFISASAWHRREIYRKNKARVAWHSMYMGTSLLPLPFSREVIFKFAEPGIVLALGWFLGGQVGLWLLIAGAALFANNHIVYHKERQALLDVRDAQIEAQYISKALSGAPAGETCGFVVAESSIALMKSDAGLEQAFADLHPELKDVLTQTPQGEKA